jgi:alkaline phosphatase
MRYLFYSVITLALSGCTPHYHAAINPAFNNKKPKNIILMIGDGMGLTQISAGLYANKNKLNLELFPYIGLHKSYPDEKGDLITGVFGG